MSLVAREPSAEAPFDGDSLVAHYAQMAHDFRPQPVDTLLRGVDAVLSGVALIVLAPLFGICALAVLASGRPILYRGARVGRAGQIFTMYKFRTLRPGAEQRLGPYLGEELTRLTEREWTRTGRLLRMGKLDELPQLYNVVRGEMSLVGPRPIRPLFFVELCAEIPAYWQRLVVRPGITGLAQLRLSREMTWAEKLVHDLEYIADRSLALYVSILAQTVVFVANRTLRP